MKEELKKHLIESGYKEWTLSGNPSTVYDYIKRIDNICEQESVLLEKLANDVQNYLEQYGIGGIKENLGKKSHNAGGCK